MARPKKISSVQIPTKKIQTLPGTLDIVSDTDPLWEVILKKFEKYVRSYGFQKTELPLLEEASAFPGLGVPAESLVVFEQGGKQVALRPMLLPSILRMYHTARVAEAKPLSKWAFMGQTLRVGPKHHFVSDMEFGFEVFGAFTHLTEAQVISSVWELVSSVGLEVSIEVNSTGQADTQESFRAALVEYLKGKKYDLCDACVSKMPDHALQILRCQELDCQALVSEGPIILDFLDPDSRKHFTNILEALEEMQIPYQLNPLAVGVEGTTGTVCLIKHKNKNETVIFGEGSYHTMISQQLTGKAYKAFGFTGSLLKIYEAVKAQEVSIVHEPRTEVYLVPLGELAAKKSLRLFRDLISAKISVYDHFGNAGVKSQLKAAQDSKSPIALIMGQKEAIDEMVILRDVKSGMQEMFRYDKIVDEVKKRLGK